MCSRFLGRTHRFAPTVGVVIPRYCRGRPVCLPFFCAVYILSPCFRGTSNGVAEGVYCVFTVFWADTSVRPYGGELEVFNVSKVFRVFKVSLADIVYIPRVL